jgi:hypothetical protein
MAGMSKNVIGETGLNNPSRIHNIDSLNVTRDHPQIMGDDHKRGIEFLHQIRHEFQELGLDGHIQGRGRLVGNDDLGVTDKAIAITTPCRIPPAELVR